MDAAGMTPVPLYSENKWTWRILLWLEKTASFQLFIFSVFWQEPCSESLHLNPHSLSPISASLFLQCAAGPCAVHVLQFRQCAAGPGAVHARQSAATARVPCPSNASSKWRGMRLRPRGRRLVRAGAAEALQGPSRLGRAVEREATKALLTVCLSGMIISVIPCLSGIIYQENSLWWNCAIHLYRQNKRVIYPECTSHRPISLWISCTNL